MWDLVDSLSSQQGRQRHTRVRIIQLTIIQYGPNVGIQNNCRRDLQLCRILRRIIPRRYKHEEVTVKSQLFGFAFVFRRRAFDLVNRPVLQLIHNHITTLLPPVFHLVLAHKPVSADHNNIPRL